MIGIKEFRVFASIRRQLVLGEWPPQARLKTSEIATKLRVSVSPIREALIRLSERGLVRNEERLGFVVNEPDPFATEAYCGLLAQLYAESIERVSAAGVIAAAAAILQSTLGSLTAELNDADAYLEAATAFRRVLLIMPYQHIAEQLDDYVAAHAAITVVSNHFYKARLRDLSIFANALSFSPPAWLKRAVCVYYTRRANEIRRASARLVGLRVHPNLERSHPPK